MTIRHIERPKSQDSLADSLLALAASLQGTTGADDTLNLLTGGLAELGITCTILMQAGPDELRLQRATLPLTPDIWGRGLNLPVLSAVLTQGRPATTDDIAGAFTEAIGGGQRALLTDRAQGTLIIAPLRLRDDEPGLLCLTSNELTKADATAVWGLALQVGAALRERTPAPADVESTQETTKPTIETAIETPSLFHELTRRLSYSLSGSEVMLAGLEVLSQEVPFQIAATVVCRDNEEGATVYAPAGTDAGLIEQEAAHANEALVKLTGSQHRDHTLNAVEAIDFPTNAAALAKAPTSVVEAPLVIDGEVQGLLRIGASSADAFNTGTERTFYTVANQISLALERIGLQQQAERAQLASLAESLSDGIVLVDSALQITSANAAATKLLEDLTEGGSLADTPMAALAKQALSTQERTELEELPASPMESRRRYLVAMAAPLAGSPEGSEAVVILRDVTEERLMQERLLQSEKMVSVGQLVSGVAHELNNPLTGIMGFAQLLLGRDLDEKTTTDVQTIHDEAERAAKIVQNLLSFARRRRAEKEPANLNALLERVLELRSYDLGVKSIGLDLQLDLKLPKTMVDADQVQQVFLNLIINAEQAILGDKESGTLTVRTKRVKDSVQVSFQDDGPGMDDDTLHRIFDPFFTTKEVGEGTGLGLTICYGIIDDHNGRIWAESRPGAGTTFIIELPIVEGAAKADPEAAPTLSVTGRSILVVDDEESIQRLLGSVLELDDHFVDTANNGREALQLIRERSYDIVITDIKMPDMDGRALFAALEKENPILASRTIFITGDTVSPDTRTFLQHVNNPVLTKPFRVREVRETIAQILGKG